MIQLQTFGALDLSSPDGQSLAAVLSQPKRALLLAYLACATPRGYHRRDVIVAVFWPELDAERARAALRQSLHFLRGSIGEGLVTRGDEVGIDHTQFTSDVAEFERAAADERLADALRLYRGDFLPGVFVKDAPDAERWIDAERGRLSRLALSCAWTLADQSVGHDPAAAATWAERAARIVPGDESVLRRRMTLLHQTGDRSSALRVYDEFIAALRRDDAETEPSLETRDLRDAIARAPVERKRSMPPAVLTEVAGAPETAATPRSTPRSTPAPEHAPPALSTPHAARPRRRRRGRMIGAVLGTAVLAAAVAAMVRFGLVPRNEREPSAAATRMIAVMPFTTRGGQLDYLRDGMVDLLSMSLDGAGELRTVEPTALLGLLAHDTSTATPFERGRATALRFNASAFVVGSIVTLGDHLEARAALYATSDSVDHPLTVATASTDETHLVSMVDQLTRGLVAGMLRSPGARLSQLAAQTTQSLPALKDYLRGTQALRVGQYDAAIDAFSAATAADSTFALAFYGLSMARGWATGGVDRRATIAAQLAVQHSSGLLAHDSLLLAAHFDHWNGRVVQAEQEYRRLLAAYPGDVEAWHELGEVLFHNSAQTGHAMRDARDPFTRVADIDALRVSALTHLARLAAIEHDSAGIDSLASLGEALAPSDPRVREIVLLRTFVVGDSSQRADAVHAAQTLADGELVSRVWDVANYAGAWRDAELLALALTEALRPAAVRAAGWTTIAQLRAAAGRPTAARAALVRATALDPAQAAFTRGLLATVGFLPASHDELQAARADVEGWHQGFAPFGMSGDGAVQSGWVPLLRRMLLDGIDARLGRPAPTPSQDSIVEAWATGARIAATAHLPEADPRANLAVLERSWPVFQAPYSTRAVSLIRLARAELLQRVGDSAGAARWFATFPAYGTGDALFRAWAVRGHARALAAGGDAAGAARDDAEAAWLWRDAEPEVRTSLRKP